LWFFYGITKALWAGEEVVHGLGIGGCSLHQVMAPQPARATNTSCVKGLGGFDMMGKPWKTIGSCKCILW